METIYRKVQFEINCKDHNETWLIGKSANFIFNPNTRNGEELSDFLAGCEEIPDTTAQLQSDKAELLDALDKINDLVTDFTADSLMIIEDISGRIIQKHKQ